MTIGFQSGFMLLALAALAIPLLVHLLNRRRYVAVDWGAMQFLQVSQTTRRRLLLEEILLMLLRMGVIAVFVLALAKPQGSGEAFSPWADRTLRDVVLVIDGSASMALDDGSGPTPHEQAKTWARNFVQELGSNDCVAVVLAREQPEILVGDLNSDHEQVLRKLEQLPAPAGSPDWPQAVGEAVQMLVKQGKNSHREIVLLHDGQRWGWADPETVKRWEKLGRQWTMDAEISRPRLRIVNLREGVGQPPPNYSLAPVNTSRTLAWAGKNLKFTTALAYENVGDYQPPWRIRFEVDGQFVQDVALPARGQGTQGRLPFSFHYRFPTPGSHLVSVLLEPDLPGEKRTPEYRIRDFFPLDNRQDLAVEVHGELPVLLVDGSALVSPESSTFYLRKALTPVAEAKRPAVVQTQVVPYSRWDPALLQGKTRPRVVVLADVPRLTPAQREGMERYLAEGGGILVVAGERVQADIYNTELFREGQGFLPARLEGVKGDASKPEQAAALDVGRLLHPALAIFQEHPASTLGQARLPRWWQATPADKNAASVAWLTSGDPLLVEKTYPESRVLLCTVPLDRSWGSTLPGVLEYPVLIHELIYYLADARSAERNLSPGQPLIFRPERGNAPNLPAQITLHCPDNDRREFEAQAWPWTFDGTQRPGVYRLDVNGGRTVHYVVRTDPRESDLTPCNEEEHQQVIKLLGEGENKSPASDKPLDLWWFFLVAVVLLLCGEVWLTRRMVAARES